MAQTVTPPRGMRDFLPADKARREHALGVIRGAYAAHGFDEIETPVMEDAAYLHSGLGGDNEKLAFAVMQRGHHAREMLAAAAEADDALGLADLGLRFDLTVPLARFYASHRAELPAVFRAIQIAPVWRAERPQKGRFRQFLQCDIDIIGEAGALAEIELITATAAAIDALGLDGCRIRINDRRILTRLLDTWSVPGRSARARPHHHRQARQDRRRRRRRRARRALGIATDGIADTLASHRERRLAPARRNAAASGVARPRRLRRAPRHRATPSRASSSTSTRPWCAAWATTRAPSSRSRTPSSATRSAAADATTA